MKRLFITALLLCTAVTAKTANPQYTETVHLKNGSIIRGIIMEQIPSQSIKLEMSDGSIFVFDYDDIEKITKEAATKRGKGKSQSDNSATHVYPRYESGIALSITSGPDTPFGIGASTTHGCLIIPYLYVGAGFGFNWLGEDTLTRWIHVPDGRYILHTFEYSLHVFGDIRGYFLKDYAVKPYANMRLGYDIMGKDIYLSPTVGARYKCLDVSVGYTMNRVTIMYDREYYIDRYLLHNFTFNIGVRF